jgi:hypothetical protein
VQIIFGQNCFVGPSTEPLDMPNRTVKIDHLRQRVSDSAKRSSSHLIGSELTESGLLDRAVLNRQIEEILEGLSEKPSLAPRMEQSLEGFLRALVEGDVAGTAQHVCALLKLELDDLRKAALLSLMVRLAGKRRFDPIASYILKNREVYVTTQG